MKVEVELAEIERLRKDLATAERESYQLKTKLESLDEKRIQQQMAERGMMVVRAVMNQVFKDLGFESVWVRDNVHRLLSTEGELWHESEDLKTELTILATPVIKQAILRIGSNLMEI